MHLRKHLVGLKNTKIKQSAAARVTAINKTPKADWIFEQLQSSSEVETTEKAPAAAPWWGPGGPWYFNAALSAFVMSPGKRKANLSVGNETIDQTTTRAPRVKRQYITS